ncbi:MAG: DUF1501 domain-containing protein [Bacteroidota bacterium]
MCSTSHRAIGLEHGAAHDDDHASWTRRDFLVRSGLAAAGAAVLLGGSPAHAAVAGAARRPGLHGALRGLNTDRVLVLVQLAGGNDGLNTVVPVRNDVYYDQRPGLSIARGDTIPLDSDYGLHTSLSPLESMWGDGHMSIVHSVGYQNQSLSHFDGIDVWATAREDGGQTGWSAGAARALGDLDDAVPPSVQVGGSFPLLMTSSEGVEGMTLSNPALLEQIVLSGELYPTADLPDSPFGRQLSFLRGVANDANLYVSTMRDAAEGVTNEAEYPDTKFGSSMAAVARLIKGGLDTRVYLVKLGGFDTHANQIARHTELLDTLGASLAAFYADLGASGDDDRTLTMTFSEFGRRVAQNGSSGTDHGTAAPLFLFGPSVAGGFHGAGPDLTDLDQTGNLPVSTDFREVYATVLGGWLGLDEATAATLLGGSYAPLDLLGQATSTPTAPDPLAIDLAPPAPNPVRSVSTVRFSLSAPADTEVAVFDTAGRRVAVIASGPHARGVHTARLDASGFASGTYLVRMRTEGASRTQTLSVIR